jgi:Bacterial PH domain
MDMRGLRSDVAAAVEATRGFTIGNGRNIRRLADRLAPGETVRRIATGKYAGQLVLLALTDRRLLFVADQLLMKKVSVDFSFNRVQSIGCQTRFGTGTIVISAAGVESEITRVYSDDARALVDDARAAVAMPTPTTAPAAPSEDIPEQIRKLADLRDAGLVSVEEFEAAKRGSSWPAL